MFLHNLLADPLPRRAGACSLRLAGQSYALAITVAAPCFVGSVVQHAVLEF